MAPLPGVGEDVQRTGPYHSTSQVTGESGPMGRSLIFARGTAVLSVTWCDAEGGGACPLLSLLHLTFLSSGKREMSSRGKVGNRAAPGELMVSGNA